MTLFPLSEVPPYNADLEGDGLPESVHALKGAAAESDGAVIFSPDYSYGMSGVLKHAVDGIGLQIAAQGQAGAGHDLLTGGHG